MPEHLRAFVLIMVVATAVFALARRPATDASILPSDFNRRCLVWFAVTSAAFLAHDYWLFTFLTALVLFIARTREANAIALFLWLLFAVPAFAKEVPGFGIIRHLMALDYPRLLAICLLVPAYINLRAQRRPGEKGWLPTDLFIAGYLAIQLGLRFAEDSFTNASRYCVYALLDVVLPYYVASRSLRTLAAFRDAAMSFVVAAVLLAVLGMYETATTWRIYFWLETTLGGEWGYGNGLRRNEWLRAGSSTGHPIAFGFVMVVALSFLAYLQPAVRAKSLWWLACLATFGGLLASISRGPWIAAVAAFVVFRLTGPKAVSGMFKAASAVGAIVAVIASTPAADIVVDLLPFVGTVEVENVDYRQRLLETALVILWQRPWFGVPGFMEYLASNDLVIGGMVDIVNTYVGVALSNGVPALACFIGAFVSVLLGVFRIVRQFKREDREEAQLLGAALLAAVAGTMVTIFTTSSITVIPVVYWALLGFGAAYVRSAQTMEAVLVSSPGNIGPASQARFTPAEGNPGEAGNARARRLQGATASRRASFPVVGH